MLQRPYGFLQNIGVITYDVIGIRILRNGERLFNCSELVARAMPRQFSRLAKKPLDFIKPDGLYDLLFPGL